MAKKKIIFCSKKELDEININMKMLINKIVIAILTKKYIKEE